MNPVAYGRAAALPHADPDRREPAAEEAGRRRFLLALEGYLRLKETTLRHGPSALDDFHAAAANLVAAKATAWERLVEGGAVVQAEATKRHLESLRESESIFLSAAETTIGSRASSRKYGMCGRIETWNVSEAEPDRGESSR
ncbi:hypothetical protein SPF06_09880 [Sinomonas sp. JGH33]|uniref:Uncharacterized protein n=1 Tax=Sinomonas terricola TaxID=3110330 RepID=A0ABU5T5S2_9MICC|nr:hypothetical protein [Sinomonas sp. JGH33]MEA5455026.1 hypothetical protein [Sinomonas sp. JGH33]